jgi:hypothetical protein
MIRKEVRRVYDAKGNLIRETTILEDGGLGQEEAEKRLKESGDMDSLFGKMDDMFKEMNNMFKKTFKE